jgi:hypothetical protein
MSPDHGSNTREYVVVLSAITAGSALAWWATSGTWAVAQEALLGEVQGSLAQAVSQRTLSASALAPAAAAMPIVGFAGLAGVIGSRGVVRRIVGMLVAVAGGVLVWSGIQASISLRVGLLVSAGEIESVVPVLPLVTAFAGGVLLAAGVAVLLRGNAWPALGANYERSSDRPRDAWEALDRGVDPTDD